MPRLPTTLSRLGAPAAALGLIALLSGCASFGWGRDRAAQVPVTAEAGDGGSATEENQTATEAATVLSEASATPAGATQADLNPTAPKQYTVKHGDTLWGIASLYLKDPWLWPEIWYVNPQVENPHLIYPGDVLALAYGADGRPQVRLVTGGEARLNPRLRSSVAYGPIATIPYSSIASFLARPSVLTREQIRTAPHVLAFRDWHKIGGADNEIYVRGLKAEKDARFSVVHVADKLKDADTGKVLGYQGVYTATALVTQPGNPAKALLTDSARETLEGDSLVAVDTNVPLNFLPRPPRRNVNGSIISVVEGVELIGQYQVVIIDRGSSDGLETGNVLAVNQHSGKVPDHHARALGGMTLGTAFEPRVRLPDERAGTLLVFKTYDHLSYALVMVANNTIHISDRVANP